MMPVRWFVSMLALMTSLWAACPLMAQHTLTLNVSGEVMSDPPPPPPPACTPNIPSGSHTRQLVPGGSVIGNVVTLPKVTLDKLNAALKTAGDITITFRATGCTGSSINNMWVHFTSANVDSNGRIIPSGNNQVRFEIRNNNTSGTLVRVGGSAGNQPNSNQGTAAPFSGSYTNSRSADKSYGVRYYAHEAVTGPAVVSASVTANFKYY